MSAAVGARDFLHLVRKGVDIGAVRAHVGKPFRFLLCGDRNLVAEFRALLLTGGDASLAEGAACLETIDAAAPPSDLRDARVVVSLTYGGLPDEAALARLCATGLPVLAVCVNDAAAVPPPGAAPLRGSWARYSVPELTATELKGAVFPHLVECARGVEIAVGRRLPALRETVAAKLTRGAAANSLKIALASATVESIPLLGLVLGAVTSASDTVAITGIQMMLLLQIEAAYGRDPDFGRLWQLLPVIGGGFGWRTLARELVGFIPVAGIPIKGAVAYAGTVVVGEGVIFFLERGRHMTPSQAGALYERTKNEALRTAGQLFTRLRRK